MTKWQPLGAFHLCNPNLKYVSLKIVTVSLVNPYALAGLFEIPSNFSLIVCF